MHFTGIHPHLQSLTVSRAFRDALWQRFPELQKSQSYWALTAYLMFWTTKSEHEGKLTISRETLASLEGKSARILTNNYSGISFLRSYWLNVWPFNVSDWSFASGLCRVVMELSWPPEIEVLLWQELNTLPEDKKDRVYLISGEPYSKKKTSALIKLEVVEARQFIQTAKQSKELMTYLMDLRPNRFTRMLKNMNDALDVVKTLSPEKQARELKILSRLSDDAQPLYRTSPNSPRIFPYRDNVLSLQRDVRKAMTKDWIECDLRNAQLAIVAKIWDMSMVNEFLKTNQSIWTYLAGSLQVELTPEVKKALKHEFLYPICFGESKKVLQQAVREVFEEELGIKNAYNTLFNLPLVQEIWKARANKVKHIHENKGIRTAFGEWLPLKKVNGAWNTLSLLAQEAQSYELKLLLPILDIAKTSNDDVVITAWQHDGFDCTCLHNELTHVRNMKHSVKLGAIRMGILTELETNSKYDDDVWLIEGKQSKFIHDHYMPKKHTKGITVSKENKPGQTDNKQRNEEPHYDEYLSLSLPE